MHYLRRCNITRQPRPACRRLYEIKACVSTTSGTISRLFHAPKPASACPTCHIRWHPRLALQPAQRALTENEARPTIHFLGACGYTLRATPKVVSIQTSPYPTNSLTHHTPPRVLHPSCTPPQAVVPFPLTPYRSTTSTPLFFPSTSMLYSPSIHLLTRGLPFSSPQRHSDLALCSSF